MGRSARPSSTEGLLSAWLAVPTLSACPLMARTCSTPHPSSDRGAFDHMVKHGSTRRSVRTKLAVPDPALTELVKPRPAPARRLAPRSRPGNSKSMKKRAILSGSIPRPSATSIAAPAERRTGGPRGIGAGMGAGEGSDSRVALGSPACAADDRERDALAPAPARAASGSMMTAATNASPSVADAQSAPRTWRLPSSPSTCLTLSVPRNSSPSARTMTRIVRPGSSAVASRTRGA